MPVSRAIAVMALAVLSLSATAGADGGKISGYMFGEYYWFVSADDATTQSQHRGSIPRTIGDQQNGFQFQRIYFTYDRSIADDFSMRYRLEANDGDYGSGAKMTPFVKHAYLRWKDAVGEADLYLGLSGTPIWGLSEKVWGYRSIEKTLLDVNKIGSSADLGVGLKGAAGKLAYHVMVGNGPGQKSEDDNGKKVYGSLDFRPSDEMHLEVYADYNMKPADEKEVTLKGFVGLKGDAFHGGVEAFMRINQKAGAGGDDQTLTGASAFGALGLGDGVKGFGRVDAISDDVTDTTDLLVIAGVDRELAEGVHLMPNVRVELPDGPDPSIQLRASCFYKF